MRASRFALVLAAVSVCLWAAAQPPATAPASQASTATNPTTRQADIDRLIGLLGDDAWETRQQAHDELVKYDQEAVGALKAALRSTNDEEVRLRAKSALSSIDYNRIFGASYITMHMKSATYRQVIAELGRQSMADFEIAETALVGQPPRPLADIDIDHMPFWEALREICPKIQLYPWQLGDRRMVFYPGPASEMRGPSVVLGPFMIVATGMAMNRSVDYGTGNFSSSCCVGLTVLVEPKLRILNQTIFRLTQAVDDKGVSLIGERAQAGWHTGASWLRHANVPLACPERLGAKLKSLKGVAYFVIPTRTEKIKIDNVSKSKGVSKTAAGLKLEVLDLTTSADSCRLKLQMTNVEMTDQQWNVVCQQYSSDLNILDANGKVMRRGSSQYQEADQKIIVDARYYRTNHFGERLGEPTTLIMDFPLEFKDLKLDFDFADLPLP